MTRPALLALLATLLASCTSRDAPPEDVQDPRFRTRLASVAEYNGLQGEGGEVKYLARVAGRAGLAPLTQTCLFQNTRTFPGHITFLKSFPELAHLDFDAYLPLVMNQSSRVLWGGELKVFSGAIHPRTQKRGVVAWFLYAAPGEDEALSIEQVREAHATLVGCAPFARDLLVLVGMDADQDQRFQRQAPALRQAGVHTLAAAALKPGVRAEGYSLGQAYGYLRRFAPGTRVQAAEVGPRDVVVAESAPEDLGVVAALVTTLPQNIHSHVNLRLREKGSPNARVAEALSDQGLTFLDGRLVRVVVREAEVEISPAPLADAEAFWKARRPQVRQPTGSLDETRIRGFAELRARDAIAYGVKAANLAELQPLVPEANRTPGFALPFSIHRDFMRDTGLAAAVDRLLADPQFHADATFRRSRLRALREAVEDASLPQGLLDRVAAAARSAFGGGVETLPLRFRSSSNVEDGELLSGAGLHDSARGCLADDLDADTLGPSRCLAVDERASLEAELARRRDELTAQPERRWLTDIIDDLQKDLANERPVARALKKVFASLWNDRAFEERAYFGIDHNAAFMGVAVNPSFVMEALDAVAVTNLDAGAGGPLYRVVSQKGRVGVVRPADPTAVAETVTFRRGPLDQLTDVRLVTRSSLSADPLWPEARLQELAMLMYTLQDHFAAHVYPGRARLSLDLEIKVTRDHRVVIKQARPYLSPP